MDADLAAVQALLDGVQAADAGVRTNAEQQLQAFVASNPSHLARALLVLATSNSTTIATKQAAFLVLKRAVLGSWSLAFEEFASQQAMDGATKAAIRADLLRSLSAPESKIRSAAAGLIVKIASVDLPDEWPELPTLLLDRISVESSSAEIQGCLTVLNELIGESLAESDFARLGEQILTQLYHIAQSQHLDWPTRSLAVECFRSVMQFFLMAGDDNLLKAMEARASAVINSWTGAFASFFAPADQTQGLFVARTQVIEAIKEFESEFSAESDTCLSKMLPVIYADFVSQADVYVRDYVNNDGSEAPDDNGMTLVNLLESEVSFFTLCFDHAAVAKQLTSDPAGFIQFIDTCVKLGQIPQEAAEAWENDFNEFTTEQQELSLDINLRLDLVSMLALLKSVPSLLSTIGRLLGTASGSWQVQESCLYILSGLLEELPLTQQHIDGDFLKALVGFLGAIEPTEPDLLVSRALILSGVASEFLGARLDKHAVKVKFLEKALTVAGQSSSATVKIAALFAIHHFERALRGEMKPYQEATISIISSLADEAAEDSPAALVEFLGRTIEWDLQTSLVSSSGLLRLLFSLASKDTANVQLCSDAQDVLERFVAVATEHDAYASVCKDSLPILLHTVTATPDGEYSSDLSVAIDLLNTLVSSGPTPLPQEVVQLAFPAVYRVLELSTDSQILQGASDAFCSLVEHSSEQLKSFTLPTNETGPQAVLVVVSKLLDPSNEDSAVLALGRLVTIVIEKFGMDLGDLLPRLLEATIWRLEKAEHLTLVENLTAVFCVLVLRSPLEVVSVLSGISMPDGSSALTTMLTKWISTFEVVRGYNEIRRNVVAFQKLYVLDDPRIKEIIVDGDEIQPEGDVIITRSKAASLKRTRISAQEKIVKLLIKELSTTPSNAIPGLSSFGDEDDDNDEWEDDLTEDLAAEFGLEGVNGQPARSHDTETHAILVDWFRELARTNAGGFDAIYPNLTQGEKQILNGI